MRETEPGLSSQPAGSALRRLWREADRAGLVWNIANSNFSSPLWPLGGKCLREKWTTDLQHPLQAPGEPGGQVPLLMPALFQQLPQVNKVSELRLRTNEVTEPVCGRAWVETCLTVSSFKEVSTAQERGAIGREGTLQMTPPQVPAERNKSVQS